MNSIAALLMFCTLAWGQGHGDDLYKDALAAAQKGDWAKAEFLFRQMRMDVPKDERAAMGIIGVLMKQGRVQDAAKTAREASLQFPKSPAPHAQLGLISLQMGRGDEALKEFESVLQLSTRDVERASAYELIGNAQVQLGSLDAAIAALRKSKQLTGAPNSRLADLLMRKGERDEAIAELRSVLRVTPDNFAALNNLAYAWADRGENLDEALRYAQRAVELRPNITPLTDTLGWVYFKKGMLVEAEGMMVKSMQQEGGTSPTHLEHLAAVMDARGDWSGDRRELRRLLDGELSAGQVARLKELLRK